MLTTMTQIRAYLAEHLATLDAAYHGAVTNFVDFLEGKETGAKAEADKITAEIEHLKSAGYTVTKAAEAAVEAVAAAG